MYITSTQDKPLTSLPDRGRDKLDAEKINAIPRPFMARMCGGGEWEVIDVEVECAIFRADICGKSQVMNFSEIMEITDVNGQKYNPDDLWND